jgi:hypothetical protein
MILVEYIKNERFVQKMLKLAIQNVKSDRLSKIFTFD